MKNLTQFVYEVNYVDGINELIALFKSTMLKGISLKRNDFNVSDDVCTLNNISSDTKDAENFYNDRVKIKSSAIHCRETQDEIQLNIIDKNDTSKNIFIKLCGEFDTQGLKVKIKKVDHVEMSKEIMDNLLK